MANRLFAPIIESKFVIDDEQPYIPIYFPSGIGYNDETWNGFSVLIKTISTGKIITNSIISNSNNWEYNNTTGLCQIKIQDYLERLTKGQYYKIQVAFCYGDTIGTYSDVGVCKYLFPTDVFIEELQETQFIPADIVEFTGRYVSNQDATEKVYKYKFDLYDTDKNLIKTTNWLLHNSKNDTISTESTNTWKYNKNIDNQEKYYIQYSIITNNGLKKSSPLYVINYNDYSITSDLGFTPIGYCDQEEGYVIIELQQKDTPNWITGTYILKRSSNEDNYNTIEELCEFNLKQWYSITPLIVFKDYTIKHGLSYKYYIQKKNTFGLLSSKQLINDEIIVDFEHMYLTDGNKQLKIKFNPKVSSFKKNVLEQKQDTLGGEYPFFFKNGYTKYKEFPISGFISLLMDENNEFKTGLLEKDAAARSSTPARPSYIPDVPTDMTAGNIQKEREFKMEVLEWLTNGEPKLFRSPTEGNFIVRLMNTSLTPNDTLGRMLHTFNSTAYEVMECNYDNLQQLGLLKPCIENYDSYVVVEEYNLWEENGGYITYYDNKGELKKKMVTDWELLKQRGWAHGEGYSDQWWIKFPYAPIQIEIYGEPGTEFSLQFKTGFSNRYYIGNTGKYCLQNTASISYIHFWHPAINVPITKIRAVFNQQDIIDPFNFISQINISSLEKGGQYSSTNYGIEAELCMQYAKDNKTLETTTWSQLTNMTTRIEDFSYLRFQIKETITIYRKDGEFYTESACINKFDYKDAMYSKVLFDIYNVNENNVVTHQGLYPHTAIDDSYLIKPEDYTIIINNQIIDLSGRQPVIHHTDNKELYYYGTENPYQYYRYPLATEGYLELHNVKDITSLKIGKAIIMDFLAPEIITEWNGLPGYEDLKAKYEKGELEGGEVEYDAKMRQLYNEALWEVKSISWEM